MIRVLYVEDNDDNIYMLKLRFELIEGFEMLVAENGATGYDKAVAATQEQSGDTPYSDHCIDCARDVWVSREGTGLRLRRVRHQAYRLRSASG